MSVVLFWSFVIVIVSAFKELTQLAYILVSLLIFCLIYLQHKSRPTKLLFRPSLLLFNIPVTLFWYLTFVYNDFLSLNPISYELLVGLYFLYLYIVCYLYCKFPQQ